jgi:hypothetical protein
MQAIYTNAYYVERLADTLYYSNMSPLTEIGQGLGEEEKHLKEECSYSSKNYMSRGIGILI